MKGLFLDDERNVDEVFWIHYPEDIEWTVVRNKDEFCSVDLSEFDIISLDHDLAEFDFTGYDAVKFLCDYYMENCDKQSVRLPTVIAHSRNPIGGRNIMQYWKNWSNFFCEC